MVFFLDFFGLAVAFLVSSAFSLKILLKTFNSSRMKALMILSLSWFPVRAPPYALLTVLETFVALFESPALSLWIPPSLSTVEIIAFGTEAFLLKWIVLSFPPIMVIERLCTWGLDHFELV